MPKRVFYSFHYQPDNWRAAQVRSMGAIEGNSPTSDNDWESIKRGGDPAIQRWIDGQLDGKSCTVVLIGSSTANRKWINYEIIKAWNGGKGVMGIYIHNLEDSNGLQSAPGKNPFDYISLESGKRLSSIAPAYNPPYTSSTDVYSYISKNVGGWVDAAVAARNP